MLVLQYVSVVYLVIIGFFTPVIDRLPGSDRLLSDLCPCSASPSLLKSPKATRMSGQIISWQAPLSITAGLAWYLLGLILDTVIKAIL
jgi:hypothetical protein